MDISLDGITRFSLNQFTGRYMLHFLARFTSYVNVRMGNPSMFDVYMDRKAKGNTYDIEHILPDRFDDYAVDFVDAHEFQTWRQHVGNLLILTRDKNRAYQDMIYQKKVECYAGDNILAQALNPIAYHKNPQFLPLAAQYGFEAIPHFNKESITSRANIYLQMAIDIWDPEAIKELAGGWTDEEEQEFTKDTRLREFTVEYLGRSWQDALKYGFLSADETNSGRYARGNDLYTLGQYQVCYGVRQIVMFKGSFDRLYPQADVSEARDILRGVLRHEFRHHIEFLGGIHNSSSLEAEDARKKQEYLDRHKR